MRGQSLAWLFGLAILYWATACSNKACPVDMAATTSLSVNGRELLVEIAATPAERSCGLSFRENLPANHGMLFVYPDMRIREFWMKDTRIPLDLAYLAGNGRIAEIHRMSPSDPEQRYRSGQSVAYALEVAGGWFEAHDVHVGDTVTIEIPESLKIY